MKLGAFSVSISVRDFESVQKSVAHLDSTIDNQLFIKGVPHLTEHSRDINVPPRLVKTPSAAITTTYSNPRGGGQSVPWEKCVRKGQRKSACV